MFHIIAVIPVITARMTDIATLLSLIMRGIPMMTALRIDITRVMPVIIRVMWHIIGITWLISGVLWLTKNEISDIIGELTGPDRDRSATP